MHREKVYDGTLSLHLMFSHKRILTILCKSLKYYIFSRLKVAVFSEDKIIFNASYLISWIAAILDVRLTSYKRRIAFARENTKQSDTSMTFFIVTLYDTKVTFSFHSWLTVTFLTGQVETLQNFYNKNVQ